MNKVYDSAMKAIVKIEDFLKGKRHISRKASVMLLGLLASMLLSPVPASAITKAEADSAYVHENYQQAINGYEALLKQGVSADLYYNLGNAYYRTDNITRAIINYERALLLSPGDDDIRFNLQMARSKTIDKITPESEMFFVTWYRSLVNSMSVDAWAHTALVTLAFAIILALLYLFYLAAQDGLLRQHPAVCPVPAVQPLRFPAEAQAYPTHRSSRYSIGCHSQEHTVEEWYRPLHPA